MCTDFNQYYNLALLKDFERTGAAFGFGAPNDFVPPINSLKSTTSKQQYQTASEPNIAVSKKPSSNYYLCVLFYFMSFFRCFFFIVLVSILRSRE